MHALSLVSAALVVGKIAEAVLSVSGMNVRCTCKQAWLNERKPPPWEPLAHCDMSAALVLSRSTPSIHSTVVAQVKLGCQCLAKKSSDQVVAESH